MPGSTCGLWSAVGRCHPRVRRRAPDPSLRVRGHSGFEYVLHIAPPRIGQQAAALTAVSRSTGRSGGKRCQLYVSARLSCSSHTTIRACTPIDSVRRANARAGLLEQRDGPPSRPGRVDLNHLSIARAVTGIAVVLSISLAFAAQAHAQSDSANRQAAHYGSGAW